MAELHCKDLPPYPACDYKAEEGSNEMALQDVLRHRAEMHPHLSDQMSSYDKDRLNYDERHPETWQQ